MTGVLGLCNKLERSADKALRFFELFDSGSFVFGHCDFLVGLMAWTVRGFSPAVESPYLYTGVTIYWGYLIYRYY